MAQQDSSQDRTAKYVVIGIAILALTFVAWIDSGATIEVPSIVYWILGGAILGAENVINILRK